MASRAAQANKAPVRVRLADGSLFACSCGSTEFRAIEDPLHLFCKCGEVHTAKDLPPLEGS